MAFKRGPQIVTNGLVTYFDVANPKCIDATQTIDTNTRLNNLAGGSLQLEPHDTSNGNMTFVLDNGNYVYNQDGLTGIADVTQQPTDNDPDPGWKSTENLNRVDDYTFIGWFKYVYGANYGDEQRRENIYGGGFKSRTSFFLSDSGVGNFNGLLRHSDVGSENSYSVGGYSESDPSFNGNDGNWHMFASTDTGGDGNQTTKFYLDGILKTTKTSNASYDTPDGASQMVWGSWNTSYGNFTGKSNCFMYYERVLSDAEILQNYNALKHKFI